MTYKICEPLKEWRPDMPSLWPTCSRCKKDIKTGQRYIVAWTAKRTFMFCMKELGKFRMVAM